MSTRESTLAENVIETTVLRVHARAFGIATGLLFGLVLFLATNVLVLKGGIWVGMHLGRLSQVLPGYEVSFAGSLVGFVYAFIVGYALGRLLAPRQRVARAAQRRTHHLAIDGARWGKTLGALFAAIPFLATNALVYKGGDTVGPFLERLSIYFPGYRVSFAGSFVALLYAFAVGYLGGRMIAWIYNHMVASSKG
jgi:hypothetical protein